MTATTPASRRIAEVDLPGYRFIARLGQGGMGVVYRAEDLHTGREVALKLLAAAADTEANARRFRREFRAAARLRHPHVATVFDFHTGPPPYYTMELVVGVPLDVYIAAAGERGSPAWSARLAAALGQILVALDVVHGAELIHRDLKPANVMVAERDTDAPPAFAVPRAAAAAYQPLACGSRPLIKLVDFGLALAGDQSAELTKAGAIVGTVEYISPEQVLGGEVDLRADLYSLGVILYELLTGQPPFRSPDTVSLLLKHAYEIAPPPRLVNPRADPTLSAVVERLLAKDPADRYPSARATLEALLDRASASPAPSSSILHLQPRPQGLFPPRLVGREDALARMQALLSRSRDGTPGLVLVAGEGGIGKSRLIEECAKSARMMGFAVVAGTAHEEQGYAFAPFLPILDALARECANDWVGAAPGNTVLAEAASALARLAPRWRQLLPLQGEATDRTVAPGSAANAEEERYQVFGALFEVADRVARGRGLLIVVEDLHHADPLSLDLLSYLLRSAEVQGGGRPLRLSIVVSVRDEEIETGSALARWREGVLRSPSALEIRLSRLGPADVAAMAQSMLGVEAVPTPVVSWLMAESQGVPFVIAELLAAFVGDGGLTRSAGRIELRRGLSGELSFPSELPQTVAETVRRRLQKLGEEERKVAAAAAVIGPFVPFDLLAAATGLAEDALLDHLQVLLARRILVESREDPDLFLFPSKIARDVLFRDQMDRRRRRAHERVAEALAARVERRPEDAVALAHHLLQAGKKEAALPHLLAALALHRQRAHNDEALAAARRAVELLDEGIPPPSPLTRLTLTRDLGEIEAALCNYERAAAAFATLGEAAAAAGAADLEIEALLGRADVDLRRGEYLAAEPRVARALALAATSGARELEARGHTARGRIAWHLGRPDEALREFNEGLACTSLPATQATALNNMGYAHFAMGAFVAADRFFSQSLLVARSRDNLLAIARSLEAKASVAQRIAAYAEGETALAEAATIMVRIGDRRGEAYCALSRGNIAAFHGRWLHALERYGEAEAVFAELGESRGIAFCSANRGRVLTLLGRFRDALDALAIALRLARKIGEQGQVAFCVFALAELWRERGEFDEARRHDVQALSAFAALGDRYGVGMARSGAAATAIGRGESDLARDHVEQALHEVAAAGGMPEVEVRAHLANARLCHDPAAAESAFAVARERGLSELAAIAAGVAADLHEALGASGPAASAREEARRRVEDLAADLGDGRSEFLERTAIAGALGLGGRRVPIVSAATVAL